MWTIRKKKKWSKMLNQIKPKGLLMKPPGRCVILWVGNKGERDRERSAPIAVSVSDQSKKGQILYRLLLHRLLNYSHRAIILKVQLQCVGLKDWWGRGLGTPRLIDSIHFALAFYPPRSLHWILKSTRTAGLPPFSFSFLFFFIWEGKRKPSKI